MSAMKGTQEREAMEAARNAWKAITGKWPRQSALDAAVRAALAAREEPGPSDEEAMSSACPTNPMTVARDDTEPEISAAELERLINKMLDYDLFADPEDVERQRVIACDLIRTAHRDTEQEHER